MPTLLCWTLLLSLQLASAGRVPCPTKAHHKSPKRHSPPRHRPPRRTSPSIASSPREIVLPPVPPPAPSPSNDSGYYFTLSRTYTDDSGTVRPGWNAGELTYMDGNIYQAAMLMVQLREPEHNMTDNEVAAVNANNTQFLAAKGAVGSVQWVKKVWDRDDEGNVTFAPTGARTGRAVVFRTATDVFVWIPGTDVGEITLDLPDSASGILDALKSGSFGLGTGDWATNFEITAYPTLQPIGVPVFKGFHDMFVYVLKDDIATLVEAKLTELDPTWAPNKTIDAKVYFIGHSQGAAMVTLAFAYYNAMGYPLGGAYVFGDPAPSKWGDQGLRNYYLSNDLWNKTFRVIDSNDPVAMVPPGDYHVGRAVQFCEGKMQTYDDFGQGSPICKADIGGVSPPTGTGVTYLARLADMVADIKRIIDRFESLMNLHTLASYGANALRAFTDISPTSPNTTALLEPQAWNRNWLMEYCLTDNDCTSQCGNLTAASACGPSYMCGAMFTCVVTPPPPPPPPPCKFLGLPCIG